MFIVRYIMTFLLIRVRNDKIKNYIEYNERRQYSQKREANYAR
jgi:hypothetical protein